MNKRIDNLVKMLTDKNIKPSYQRIKILQYLNENIVHPTVDTIYNNLIKDMPTISKATIYNTMELFKSVNLVKVVNIENNETRYDSKVGSHGHFKCETCSNIYDFEVNIDSLDINSLKDFKINDRNVYFKGICPRCKNRKYN